MRTLLIGALPATLIGCSCLVPPQASLERTERLPIELKPATSGPTPAPARVKSAVAKTPKPAQPDDRATPQEKTHAPATSTATMTPPGRPADASDPVLARAKATIAAKMENPDSAEFGDMKRAIRKNTFGKPVDTICGHVKGKKISGEETEERPFLYLVTEDEAYVVDGNAESAAAIAYRNICIEPGAARKGTPPAKSP
jgi:hypothetical protein